MHTNSMVTGRSLIAELESDTITRTFDTVLKNGGVKVGAQLVKAGQLPGCKFHDIRRDVGA